MFVVMVGEYEDERIVGVTSDLNEAREMVNTATRKADRYDRSWTIYGPFVPNHVYLKLGLNPVADSYTYGG